MQIASINCKYNAHTEPLFKKLNLLQLQDLFTLNIVKLFYKVKTKTLPEYFQEMFPAANQSNPFASGNCSN